MRAVRAATAATAAFASALSLACAGAAAVATTPSDAAASNDATSPVNPPRPGILGCVESRELKDYVLALDSKRQQARQAALDALGSTSESRRGAFGVPGGVALDQSYEAQGQRFAVAAELAPQFEPSVTLAKRGSVLRRIDERPRAHAVDVLVCGLQRCVPPSTGQRVEVRPLVIALAPGESWGGALELGYDYWWARVRYNRSESCATP